VINPLASDGFLALGGLVAGPFQGTDTQTRCARPTVSQCIDALAAGRRRIDADGVPLCVHGALLWTLPALRRTRAGDDGAAGAAAALARVAGGPRHACRAIGLPGASARIGRGGRIRARVSDGAVADTGIDAQRLHPRPILLAFTTTCSQDE